MLVFLVRLRVKCIQELAYIYDGRGKTGLLRVRSHSNMLYMYNTHKKGKMTRESVLCMMAVLLILSQYV